MVNSLQSNTARRRKMNSKYLILSLCLLAIPACRPRRARIVPARPGYPAQVEPVPVVEQPMPAPEEEVTALPLEEDENPFNTQAATQGQQAEEITLENVEPTTGDLYADSAQHGLKTIYYNFDQHNVRNDQKSALEHNLQVAHDLTDKGYDLTIEGHACNSAGDKNYNIILSEKRAESVKQYLTDQGVDPRHIRTVGWGYERPIVQFGNQEQQAPNRRVEIYAYKHDKHAPQA
jgi:outer membrane protein OmpA-like peptidoglycan-associated protein